MVSGSFLFVIDYYYYYKNSEHVCHAVLCRSHALELLEEIAKDFSSALDKKYQKKLDLRWFHFKNESWRVESLLCLLHEKEASQVGQE